MRRRRPNSNIRQRPWRVVLSLTIGRWGPRSGPTTGIRTDRFDWEKTANDGRAISAARLACVVLPSQPILSFLLPGSYKLIKHWAVMRWEILISLLPQLMLTFRKLEMMTKQQNDRRGPRTRDWSRIHSHSLWRKYTISNSCRVYCRAFSSIKQHALLLVQARANLIIC